MWGCTARILGFSVVSAGVGVGFILEITRLMRRIMRGSGGQVNQSEALAKEYLKQQNGSLYEDEDVRSACTHAFLNGYSQGQAFSYRQTYYEFLEIRRQYHAERRIRDFTIGFVTFLVGYWL